MIQSNSLCRAPEKGCDGSGDAQHTVEDCAPDPETAHKEPSSKITLFRGAGAGLPLALRVGPEIVLRALFIYLSIQRSRDNLSTPVPRYARWLNVVRAVILFSAPDEFHPLLALLRTALASCSTPVQALERQMKARSKRAKSAKRKKLMLKILIWAVVIIFVIGLLVVTGILKMIF